MTNRRKRSKSKKVVNEDCNIDINKCKKNQKFNKNDILELAKKCGVDVYNDKGKEKYRNQLCDELDILKNTKDDDSVYESEIEIETDIILPPILTIEEPKQRFHFTKEELNKKKKDELINIALDLRIEKWKGKSIKYQNKPIIIEAILHDQKPISPKPISPKPISPKPILEIPKKKGLNRQKLEKTTKKNLLIMANNLGIEKWEGKIITRHNKPEIIDALIDFEGEEREDTVAKEDIIDLIDKKRKQLIDVLKIQKPKICDPVLNDLCDNDNVCDIEENICISKEEAEYREKNEKDINSVLINGKKVIGNNNSLKKLMDIMDILDEQEPSGGVEETKGPYEEETPVILQPLVPKKPVSKHTLCNMCTYVNDPDSTECIICNSDLTEKEIGKIYPEGTVIPDLDDEIPEGTEITDLDTIEDILNKIQKRDDISLQNISQMDKSKKEVLYCLGLLN